MRSMQSAGKVAAAIEPRYEFVEDVVARGPEMFMEVGDEVIARREAMVVAVELRWGLACRLTPRLVYVISYLDRCLVVFVDHCRGIHRRGCNLSK